MSGVLTVENFDNFVFKNAIYTKMQLPYDKKLLELFVENHYALNLFCVECQEVRTFTIDQKEDKLHAIGSSVFSVRDAYNNLMNRIDAHCNKDNMHKIKIFFQTSENEIIKIGQYPSNLNFLFPDKNKYDRLLGKYAIEYKTALQVYSYGTGIGSFVYLRRVFEFLVEEFHQKSITKNGWNEDKYKNSRIKEKIQMIETHHEIFPTELSQYTGQIYGVLSKGVHELDENECLSLFPTLKYLIERILDKQVEETKQAAKLQEAVKLLQPK